MSVVYRYDIVCGESCNSNCGLEPAKDGEWIAYEDYAAVEKERDTLHAEVERFKSQLRAADDLIETLREQKAQLLAGVY